MIERRISLLERSGQMIYYSLKKLPKYAENAKNYDYHCQTFMPDLRSSYVSAPPPPPPMCSLLG